MQTNGNLRSIWRTCLILIVFESRVAQLLISDFNGRTNVKRVLRFFKYCSWTFHWFNILKFMKPVCFIFFWEKLKYGRFLPWLDESIVLITDVELTLHWFSATTNRVSSVCVMFSKPIRRQNFRRKIFGRIETDDLFASCVGWNRSDQYSPTQLNRWWIQDY